MWDQSSFKLLSNMQKNDPLIVLVWRVIESMEFYVNFNSKPYCTLVHLLKDLSIWAKHFDQKLQVDNSILQCPAHWHFDAWIAEFALSSALFEIPFGFIGFSHFSFHFNFGFFAISHFISFLHLHSSAILPLLYYLFTLTNNRNNQLIEIAERRRVNVETEN